VKLDRDEWDRDLHRKPYHVEIADKILGQLSACALRMMHHFEGSGCNLTTKSKQDSRSTRMVLHVTSDVIYARVQGNPQGLGGLVQGPAHISSRFYDQNELKRVIFRCKLAVILHGTYSSDNVTARLDEKEPALVRLPNELLFMWACGYQMQRAIRLAAGSDGGTRQDSIASAWEIDARPAATVIRSSRPRMQD
jgi:hypothetical protein